MECKDCTQFISLKNEITNIRAEMDKCHNKYEKELDTLRDKVTDLDKQGAVTDEQIKSIFKILNEIKDSIQTIAISLEEKPSVDDYTRKQIDTMEEEIKDIKEEGSKTYNHIKVAVITAILCSACTFIITKVLGG